MATPKYCTLHRIGYNPELDPGCPQCLLGRFGSTAPQVDDLAAWDKSQQGGVAAEVKAPRGGR